MPKYPCIPTRVSLLARLKNPEDRQSWQTFFDTYWRLIHGHAINGGLTEDEAQEVVQETLIEVSGRIKTFQYDARIGSFKAWLFHLTRWRIGDQFRKRRPADVSIDIAGFEDHRADTPEGALALPWVEPDSRWEDEWQQAILDAAMKRLREQMRPKHFQVFDLIVNKQWPVAKVASMLKMNRGHVHLVKFRGLLLLKKELARLEKGRI